MILVGCLRGEDCTVRAARAVQWTAPNRSLIADNCQAVGRNVCRPTSDHGARRPDYMQLRTGGPRLVILHVLMIRLRSPVGSLQCLQCSIACTGPAVRGLGVMPIGHGRCQRTVWRVCAERRPGPVKLAGLQDPHASAAAGRCPDHVRSLASLSRPFWHRSSADVWGRREHHVAAALPRHVPAFFRGGDVLKGQWRRASGEHSNRGKGTR